jgi:hypothetical protein
MPSPPMRGDSASGFAGTMRPENGNTTLNPMPEKGSGNPVPGQGYGQPKPSAGPEQAFYENGGAEQDDGGTSGLLVAQGPY